MVFASRSLLGLGFLTFSSFLVSCGTAHKGAGQEAQGSTLGETRASGLDADPKARMIANWEEALETHTQQPTEDTAIWVGRRLGYLGRYEEAVDWFTARLTEYPDSYRLLRHRGHRHITLRRFDLAIEDLGRAWSLAKDRPNRVEPDGAPGPTGIPRSTDHGNILYHLGLAYYLEGQFEKGAEWFGLAVQTATNDDSDVAARVWLVSCLQRAGRFSEAQALLEPDFQAMDVIENFQYRDLLLHFSGRLSAGEALAASSTGIASATLLYGLANRQGWDGGDNHDALEHVQSIGPNAAFGVIAAEADLARR